MVTGLPKETMSRYLLCAMDIGEELLLSGAEVSRVEETVERILLHFGAARVDVFSITSSILVTVYLPAYETITQSRRIRTDGRNLKKLEELNLLSRRICEEDLAPDEIRTLLKQIRRLPAIPLFGQIAAYAVVSASFTAFFGGDFADVIAGGLIGAVLRLWEELLRRGTSQKLAVAFFWSLGGGLLSHTLVMFGCGHHPDLISIGNIMLYIPGIALTNSIRDLFTGDTITGLIRFAEALLLAATIAFGFVLAGVMFG